MSPSGSCLPGPTDSVTSETSASITPSCPPACAPHAQASAPETALAPVRAPTTTRWWLCPWPGTGQRERRRSLPQEPFPVRDGLGSVQSLCFCPCGLLQMLRAPRAGSRWGCHNPFTRGASWGWTAKTQSLRAVEAWGGPGQQAGLVSGQGRSAQGRDLEGQLFPRQLGVPGEVEEGPVSWLPRTPPDHTLYLHPHLWRRKWGVGCPRRASSEAGQSEV